MTYGGLFSGALATPASACAHIFIRIRPFISQLEIMKSSSIIVPILFDLSAQLKSKEPILDIFPLLQYTRANGPFPSPADFLRHVLTSIDSPPNAAVGRSYSSSRGSALFHVVKVEPPQSPTPALDRLCSREVFSSEVIFFDIAVNSQAVPQSLTTSDSQRYSLFCAVVQVSFDVFLRDHQGWLMMSDRGIEQVQQFSGQSACLLGFIRSLDDVAVFRYPPTRQADLRAIGSAPAPPEQKCTIIVNVLDLSRMEFDRSEVNCDSKRELLQRMSEISLSYEAVEVFYQTDMLKPPSKIQPREMFFETTVGMFIGIGRKGMLSNFLDTKPVALTFQDRDVPQLTIQALFHPNDNLAAVFRFVEALVFEVLGLAVSSGVRLYDKSDEEIPRHAYKQLSLLAGKTLAFSI
jgi:hypothetical protein